MPHFSTLKFFPRDEKVRAKKLNFLNLETAESIESLLGKSKKFIFSYQNHSNVEVEQKFQVKVYPE